MRLGSSGWEFGEAKEAASELSARVEDHAFEILMTTWRSLPFPDDTRSWWGCWVEGEDQATVAREPVSEIRTGVPFAIGQDHGGRKGLVPGAGPLLARWPRILRGRTESPEQAKAHGARDQAADHRGRVGPELPYSAAGDPTEQIPKAVNPTETRDSCDLDPQAP